ncbi:septum formation initiator family protein [Acidipila sp. EB88]|uniref:cell division protein FtsL n=1 Tax=Acidipila sp. EB88 TaxID=2305226 RepID=UPI000F5ECF10|nr:septum formation initiator family protein [Acidipila sp. EB88]RRA48868.1 cell division protein FtsL [Acidipila sp. EB88]
MATQVLSEIFSMAREVASPEPGDNRHGSRLMAEQRVRRGPTPEIFFTKRMDNSRLVKAQCPERKREMRSFASAMVMLFALVMFYGWQHYSSIQAGYHVETQKQQLAQLQEQNRQLRLSEAQLSDPARIDRMARQMGLQQPAPGQVVRPDGLLTGADGATMAMARELPLGR